MVTITEKCGACGMCVEECVAGALSYKGDGKGYKGPECDSAKCISCGACAEVCPMDAIKVE